MSVGDRLREERERLGLSQPKMAEMMGATKQTIYAWENGRTAPDGFQLETFSAAGADVRYIITGERDGPPPLKPDEQLLLDRYRSSPAPLRDAALRVLLGGGEPPASGARSIKIAGGSGHQVAGRNIINGGGGKKK